MRRVLLALVLILAPAATLAGATLSERIRTEILFLVASEQIVTSFKLFGDSHAAHLDRLRAYATREEIPVYDVPVLKDLEIWGAASCFATFNGNRCFVLLDTTGSINHRFSTLIHELAHTRIRGNTVAEGEIIAETVAYLTCANVGLNTQRESISYIYLHGLLGGPNTVAAVLDREQKEIQNLVDEFTKAAKP